MRLSLPLAAALVLRLSVATAVALSAAACQRTQAPAVDCSEVGERLTTFEIGTTATPEQRAPIVAKHKAACQTASVTAADVACLRNATDTWTARACFPRMFPKSASGATGNAACATVTTRMREAIMADVGSNGSAAAAQLAKILPVIETACSEDAWPGNIVKCIGDGKPGDMTAFQSCMNQLPQEHQGKLSQRLSAAMQQP